MNYRDLKYLVAVATHQHFSKAAQACFVSQPTLSAQLKKLEDELGVQLFERNNKQVLITAIGQKIIAQARIALREMEQLRTLAQLSKDPMAGHFKLGIIPTLAPYLLPIIIPVIKKRLPKLELYLYEDKTDKILEQLKQGELDAIILALPVASQGLIVQELFNEPFLIALPAQHSLCQRDSIKLNDLKQEKLLLLAEGHCLRDQALEVCSQVGLLQDIGYQATSLETLRQMIITGAGITLLPYLAIKAHKRDPLLAIRPFSKPVPYRKIGLLSRQNNAREDCCELMAKLIAEAVEKVLM